MNKQTDSKKLILECAKAAIDKKAENSIIFDVSKISGFTDYFLVTSGTNEKQVQAISDEIVRQCKTTEIKPRVEGYEQGRWILIDLGSAVVHVFHDYIREFYRLEELWGQAPRLAIPVEFYESGLPQKPTMSASQSAST